MAIKRVVALAEKYTLLDSLLFKVNPEKETVVLAVSEACIDKIITLITQACLQDIREFLKHI